MLFLLVNNLLVINYLKEKKLRKLDSCEIHDRFLNVIDVKDLIDFRRRVIKSRTIDTYYINRDCRHTFRNYIFTKI